MSAALRDTLREARFFGGLIGALWFACYLYELGFLARFGVPPMLAEIGFSWPLGAVLLAGPAAALPAAALLRLAGGCRPEALFTTVTATLALGLALGAAAVGRPMLALLTGVPPRPPLHPIKLTLFLCLVFYVGLLFTRFRQMIAWRAFGAVAQSSLLILLLAAVPVGLGWFGGGKKMENRRSFLYLVDRPDFVLVRLYDDKAVFVRYDARAGAFGRDWLIHRFADPNDAYVTLRPAGR